jgi:hypothetical protein
VFVVLLPRQGLQTGIGSVVRVGLERRPPPRAGASRRPLQRQCGDDHGGGKLKDLSLDSTQMLITRVFWLCAGSEFSLGSGEKGLTATVMITPLAPTGDLAWSNAKLFTGP